MRVSKHFYMTIIAYIQLIVCFFYSYMNDFLRGLLGGTVVLLVILTYIFGTKRRHKKKNMHLIIYIIFLSIFIFWRNFDIKEGYYGRAVYLLMSLCFLSMMIASSRWCYSTIKNLRWIAILMVIWLFVQQIRGTLDNGDMNLLIHCEILLSISIAGLCVKDNKKVMHVIFILLVLVVIFISNKRGPLLFHICGIIAVFYLSSIQKTKKRTIILFVSYSLIIVFMLFGGILFGDAFGDIMSQFYTDDFSSGRVTLYNRAIELFNQSPIIGLGWSGYRKYSGIFGYEVHNIYLQMLCEIGIIGTILFISLFIWILKKTLILIRNNENSRELLRVAYISLYGQIYFLFYGLTGNPLYDFNFILYGYFAAMSITLFINKKKGNYYE